MKIAKTAGAIAVAILVAVAAAWSVFRLTRPAPPDLNDPAAWTLIKADHRADPAVRVYVVERQSTTWDAYEIAQNKIVVRDGKGSEFQWPDNYSYAAGWCEIQRATDRRIAVVLFGNATVRAVLYDNGHFVFRPDRDALLAEHELVYEPVPGGAPAFIVREVGTGSPKSWQWTPETGFRSLEKS